MVQKHAARFRIMAMGALILFVVAVMAACAGNGANKTGGNEEPSKATETTPAAETTNPEETQQPETATTRTVKDAYGDAELPAKAERIVVLNTSTLENLLALGVKPVGAPYSISVNANFFAHLVDQTEGIENIGTVDQPNLEAIAKLNPDLIIGQLQDHEAVYEELKAIAPVYMTGEASNKWKDALRGHADAVNKREEAENLLGEYEARITKFRADMGQSLEERTVTLIRPRADHIRIHLGGSFSGSVVEETGLKRTEPHAGSADHHVAITEEQIGDMDSDVILSFGREHEAEFFEEKIKKNPLWNTLAAVQNDQVHMMNWEVWLSGQGIQSANLIIDDLNRIFLP